MDYIWIISWHLTDYEHSIQSYACAKLFTNFQDSKHIIICFEFILSYLLCDIVA